MQEFWLGKDYLSKLKHKNINTDDLIYKQDVYIPQESASL